MNGTFQITNWDETPYKEGEHGSKKSHAKITQKYSGIIEGTSELQYLISYQSESSASFVGFEVITGQLNGQSGSFTLQHNGQFDQGIASSSFIIVPNSGTGEFNGLTGSGSFKSGETGQADYELILNI